MRHPFLIEHRPDLISVPPLDRTGLQPSVRACRGEDSVSFLEQAIVHVADYLQLRDTSDSQPGN